MTLGVRAALLLAVIGTGGASVADIKVTPVVTGGHVVTSFAAPDAFTTPGRDTGLPAGLWRGASAKTARTVLPLLAAKALSPAGAALARRVLATGAPGPQGVGSDPALAGARASALLVQGDARAASAICRRRST